MAIYLLLLLFYYWTLFKYFKLLELEQNYIIISTTLNNIYIIVFD